MWKLGHCGKTFYSAQIIYPVDTKFTKEDKT